MAFQTHSNFGYGTVATAPSPADSGTTLVLGTATFAQFPDPGTARAYNVVVWPTGTIPLAGNAEVFQIASKGTDGTVGIVRAQESSVARSIESGDQVAIAWTKLKVTEIQDKILQPQQGFMINGKIVTSVASSDLTVAIKTEAGNDPTVADPVYVRIGDTTRTITAALSKTLADGTNWFVSGSSMLATKEIDYFVYLGYNATDGVVLGFARIPYGRVYSDFNTTAAHEDYCAISTITNAAATDQYENVGRFNAVLSAGAGYTWTIPATSIVISRPIFETRWLSWTPTYGGTGSMTFTSVSTNEARYKISGDSCVMAINATGTTGGTASARITFTIPFPRPGGTSDAGFGAAVIDAGVYLAGFCITEGSTTLGVGRYDGANWGLSSSDNINALPTYRISD